jgi:hypothetical protein
MNENKINYDLIVIGSGAAGIMSAIHAVRDGKKVLLLEKLPKIAAKLKATGGGRCNLTNTLSDVDFMACFGREGRFMSEALTALNHKDLMEFFSQINVETHAPDGVRVFPITHSSSTIIAALENEMKRLEVTIKCSCEVKEITFNASGITGVSTQFDTYKSSYVVVATGGLGYPVLGAHGDGYEFAKSVGHKVTQLSPAMMPLHVKETWVGNCRADTIAKVTMRVNLPKEKKLQAQGDLIFTKSGIRGPVVLDFAREITPLLKKYREVPLLMNLTKGMNEEQIRNHFKNEAFKNPEATVAEVMVTLLPEALCNELCILVEVGLTGRYKKLEGKKRDNLIKILAWTPLTVTGHDGFKMAMITRGGVSLKEINPKSMESKLIKGLYFCGEVLDLDGPCGGYNLQWSFASGYLAGALHG